MLFLCLYRFFLPRYPSQVDFRFSRLPLGLNLYVCLYTGKRNLSKVFFLPSVGSAQAPLWPWKWVSGNGKWINAACLCCTVSMNCSGLLLFLLAPHCCCARTSLTWVQAHSLYITYCNSINNGKCLWEYICLYISLSFCYSHLRIWLGASLCAHLDAYREFYGGPLKSKYNISEKKKLLFRKFYSTEKTTSQKKNYISDNNNISGNIHFALKCCHLL